MARLEGFSGTRPVEFGTPGGAGNGRGEGGDRSDLVKGGRVAVGGGFGIAWRTNSLGSSKQAEPSKDYRRRLQWTIGQAP